MPSPYDLLVVTAHDLAQFERNHYRSKIRFLLSLIFNELPTELKSQTKCIDPCLRPIEGFEDKYVRGYEVAIDKNREIEIFMRKYIPFFILMKKQSKD